MISDRPFETWLEEFRAIKKRYPDKILIASIMEECRREAWQEIVERVQATGVDGLELNLSCPHGLPERKMGAAMGCDPEIAGQVVRWVMEVAKVPVWAKMTPNVSDPRLTPAAVIDAGCHGISAINTVLCVAGVDLKTLRPLPDVEGATVPGGYSGKAVLPIALRHVMEIAKTAKGRASLSGMGGIYTGKDAAQFIAMGCNTVQVCTGAMLQGYEVIRTLTSELVEVLREHNFADLDALRGVALSHFSTHAGLVEMQRTKRAERAGGNDSETWKGNIQTETEALVSKS